MKMNESNQSIRKVRHQQLVDYANQIAITASKYDESGVFPFEHFSVLEKISLFEASELEKWSA